MVIARKSNDKLKYMIITEGSKITLIRKLLQKNQIVCVSPKAKSYIIKICKRQKDIEKAKKLEVDEIYEYFTGCITPQ
tara:strand:- start:198 stop:431 length:234 start_codon:yes stop_codon:yes gene_type:complete